MVSETNRLIPMCRCYEFLILFLLLCICSIILVPGSLLYDVSVYIFVSKFLLPFL